MNNTYTLYKGMAFVISTIVLSASAQLLMKYGMLELAHSNTEFLRNFALDTLNPTAILWVLAGLACYAVSMLFWMAALTKYELSFAYPLLSLSYVLVYLGASLWPGFNETITGLRSSGIALIVTGVVLVTRTKHKSMAGH